MKYIICCFSIEIGDKYYLENKIRFKKFKTISDCKKWARVMVVDTDGDWDWKKGTSYTHVDTDDKNDCDIMYQFKIFKI